MEKSAMSFSNINFLSPPFEIRKEISSLEALSAPSRADQAMLAFLKAVEKERNGREQAYSPGPKG